MEKQKQKPMCSRCGENEAQVSYAEISGTSISLVPLCKKCFSLIRDSFQEQDAKEVRVWLKDIIEKNSFSYDDLTYSKPVKGYNQEYGMAIDMLRGGMANNKIADDAHIYEKFERQNLMQRENLDEQVKTDTGYIIDPFFVFTQESLGATCKCCGLCLIDYLKQAIIGCPMCLFYFRDYIKEYIATIETKQRNIEIEKINKPNKQISYKKTIEKYNKEKQKAIDNRDYKLAARYRDEIIKIRKLIEEKEKIEDININDDSGGDNDDGISTS